MRCRCVWAAMLLCACQPRAHPSGASDAKSSARAAAISVKDFGAKGDGVTDDRDAIQAAIAAGAAGGADVYLPPGTYSISGVPGGYVGFDVPGGVHLRGAGQATTVLRQAPGASPSVRLLRLSGDDIVLEDLTLDGNKLAQTANEQRHGIFATHTAHLVVRRVTARSFTGDGFYLYDGARDSLFVDTVAIANDRNGITLGGNVDETRLVRSKFAGNRAQQVDSEPGGTSAVTRTTISGCELDGAGVSNDYALTVSGTSSTKGSHWIIIGNKINGGVFVVWAERVFIAGNAGINPTPKPSVTVYRTSSDIAIVGNRFELTQTGVRELSGILVQGTGTGSAPERVLVLGNDLSLGYERSFGVRAEGAISVAVLGNVLRGAGRSAPGYVGIFIRATNQAEAFRTAIVSGNTVRNFGSHAVSLVGNGTAKILSVNISNNTFDNDTRVPSMTSGISLDDGTGAARQISVTGNRYLRGVTRPMVNGPADKAVISGADLLAP